MATNRSDIIIGAQNTASKELLAVGRNARAAAKAVETFTTALNASDVAQRAAGQSAVGYAGAMRVVGAQVKQATEELRAYNQELAKGGSGKGGGVPTVPRVPTTPTPSLPNADQAARQLDRLRDSEIRAARASGDYGRALNLIDGELSRASQGTVRYNDLLARQARASKQAEEGSRSFASAFNGIQSALGAAGLAVGAQQLLQFGVAAFQESQQLKGTQASLRVLSGDTTRYNQVLDLARQNQSQFGGSLQENIAQLTGFTVAARRSGVAVSQLNDLSRRLAVLSPEQGAAGASIAINEALSGNATSLVRRFEIPQQLLKGIGDESTTAAQKLAILSDALDKSGVSADAVAASTTTAQRAVNSASAAFDTLKTNIGEGSAPAVERLATGFSRLLGVINSNPQAIAELKAILSGKSTINQGDLDAAKAGVASQTKVETRAQVGYAGGLRDFTPARIDTITESLVRAKAAGGDFATTADRILQAYRDAGQQGAAEFSRQADLLGVSLLQTTNQISAQRPEMESLTDRTKNLTTALGEQLIATQAQRVAQEQANAAQKDLDAIGPRVANGLIGVSQAADILATKYGFAANEALRLAQNAALAAGAKMTDVGRKDRDLYGASGTGAPSGSAADIAARRAANQIITDENAKTRAAAALTAARQAQAQATETNAQKVTRLTRESKALGATTAEGVAKQTELLLAEKALTDERTRNAKTAATADGKAVRSAEDLRKARFDLLSTEQQIADLKQRVASGRLSEVDRLEATKQIRDLEEKITDEREKQTKSAIDARLAALDDAKQRRIEERELAAARRVLASGATSQDQKASAADVLQRVELERQKRALEIADKTRDAGGVSAALPSVSAPGRGPVVALLPGAAGGAGAVASLPNGAAAGGDISQQLLEAFKQIALTVIIDGKPVAGTLVATLRSGLEAARAGGIGRS